jgi:hypothetical protein
VHAGTCLSHFRFAAAQVRHALLSNPPLVMMGDDDFNASAENNSKIRREGQIQGIMKAKASNNWIHADSSGR